MLYISTTKTMSAAKLEEGDKLLVFYKNNDVLKMDDFSNMLAAGILPSICEQIKDRDDMLVLLGGYLAKTDDKVTILDSAIPIPKRYADRIVPAKSKPATKVVRKRTKKNVVVTKPEIKTSIIEEPDLMNAPETGTKETIVGEKKDDAEPVFEDKQAEQLYRMLKLKSEDIGFHWPTEMLMLNIIKDIENSTTDADCEMAIRSRNNGNKVWSRVKEYINEIREMLKENA